MNENKMEEGFDAAYEWPASVDIYGNEVAEVGGDGVFDPWGRQRLVGEGAAYRAADGERVKMERLGKRMPGYCAMMLGEWDKHPERRRSAVEVFGEDVVKGYEEADEVGREGIASRLWIQDMKEEGEGDAEYLLRRLRADRLNGSRYQSARTLWAAQKEAMLPKLKEREANAESDRLYWQAYTSGRELQGEDFVREGGAMRRASRGIVEKARRVRAWMKLYVNPLREEKSGEAILRKMDGLVDAFYELIGDDAEMTRIAVEALMGFAREVKDERKVSVVDDFVIAVGRKLSEWADLPGAISAQEVPKAMEKVAMHEQNIEEVRGWIAREGEEKVHATVPSGYAAEGMTGQPLAGMESNRDVLAEEEAQLERARRYVEEHAAEAEKWERTAVARGNIYAAMDEATRLTDKQPWYWDATVGVARSAAEAVGQTSVYLAGSAAGSVVGAPWLGMAAGSVDQLVAARTNTYSQLRAQGLSHEAALNEAMTQGFINAGVEMIPGSAVGGMGLHRTLGWLARRGSGVAAAVAQWTSKSVWRAWGAEALAGTVDEALIEPIAGGLAQWGMGWAYDVLGVAHGKSKPFAENFDELAQMVGDARQLAGTMLFCAALSAGGTLHVRVGGLEYTGGLRASVNEAKLTREELEEAGYTVGQIDRLMAQREGEKVKLARELLTENMTKDARGWRQRVIAANPRKYAGAGSALKYSGALEVNPTTGKGISAVMRGALAAAWNEQVRRGQVPAVERQADGMMKLTKYAPVTGEVEWEDTMSEEEADRYLQVALGEADDARRLAIRAQYGLEGERKARGGLRAAIMSAVEARAGKAAERSVAETTGETGIALEDVTEHLPEDLAAAVKEKGHIDVNIAERISAWALGVIDELVGQGMTPEEARKTRWAQAKARGHAQTLGFWANFERKFTERREVGNISEAGAQMNYFRTRAGRSVINGRQVLNEVIFSTNTKGDALPQK